jgi:uncharacterized SAM-binding protein YcdF (DUF218 family)
MVTGSSHTGGALADKTPPLAHAGRRRRRRTWILAASIILLLFAAATVRLFVRPELPPLPPTADAIIELGGPGNRDAVALDLARAHRAPLLIQSTVENDATSDTCLEPVPQVRIMCFHAEPNTTQGEARYIGRMGEQYQWKSVFVVTSPDHAWRARLLIERCFPGKVYIVTTHLPPIYWFRQIPYQWLATAKALTIHRRC